MRAPLPRAPCEGSLSAWLGAAAILHVAAFAASRGLDANRAGAPAAFAIAEIDVTTDLTAASAKAPDPPPAAAPSIDASPGGSPRAIPAPPSPKPPSPRPASGSSSELRERIESRLVNALSAVAEEASKILTSDQGNGPPMATGNADVGYGMVAGDGKGNAPTFDRQAGLRGRPGGSGPPPPDDGPDRSRGAEVFMGYNTDCDFPDEADRDRIDHGWAMLVVNVLPNGRAAGVQVLGDSGHGFGRMARACALRARYRPALDKSGTPIQADTPAFRYRFTR